ncbi:hypothetical protein ACHDRG_001150 [Clostridioides difficile]|nr:hypothetical protein QEE_1642 [Clostridioides difficile CD113]
MECKFKFRQAFRRLWFGFILTIWNVNTLPTFEVHKDDLKFYINYMECKSKQLVALLKTTARFILTIWNINSNSDIFILII